MKFNNKTIKFCYNVFKEEDFLKCNDYSHYIFTRGTYETNHSIWDESIIKDSHIVLIHKLNHKLPIFKMISDVANEKLNISPTGINFYAWTPGSYIPWHDDDHWKAGATIYLNNTWEKDWGGCFLYVDENDEIRGHYPERNTGVTQRGGIYHHVTRLGNNVPYRYTIQLYENR